MAQVNSICKVCGAEYRRCRSCENIPGGSWRLIACSPECYIAWCDLIEARKTKNDTQPDMAEKATDTAEAENSTLQDADSEGSTKRKRTKSIRKKETE